MSKEKQRGRSALETISNTAQEIVLRDGFHLPTLIVMGQESTATIQIVGNAESYTERAAVMRMLGSELGSRNKLGGLKQVFLINEGWVSQPDPDLGLNPIHSQDP